MLQINKHKLNRRIKDWKTKAMENYERFLTLWKDADPGIAEVVDVKERVAEQR